MWESECGMNSEHPFVGHTPIAGAGEDPIRAGVGSLSLYDALVLPVAERVGNGLPAPSSA